MAQPQSLTVLDGVIACGISNAINPAIGSSPAQRIAQGFFDNNFQTCMTLKDKEIDTMNKTFSDLNQQQGQVRLMPHEIRRLKAFTQHVCHLIRLELDPGDCVQTESPNLRTLL